ncbi:MAG: hypothetical protein M3R41_05615 [Pseudomonadota bacterium]|nr:hypothetical protein [Pseudomonadota bacterium]
MTNLRLALEKRYSSLAGRLEDAHANIDRIRREVETLDELEAGIPKLEALVASAEMLLRDANPDWKPEQTPALKPWTHNIPVPFGSCGRRGMTVLLNAGEKGLTVREVALEVLRGVGCDEPDRETIRRTQAAVEASFRKFKGRTVESSGKYPMQWRSIARPEITFDP